MRFDDHPRETTGCANCDAPPSTWEPERELPQVGQTYACSACSHEVYVYDAGDQGETRRQFRPVTDTMATNLQFFSIADAWPDDVCEDLYTAGVERPAAIDYHVVEREGLSQSEWARRRDVSQPTVSGNVAKAREQLGEE